MPAPRARQLPTRDLTTGTAIEQQNTGPGGVYVRLEDPGHALTHFQEAVRIGQASEHEAAQLDLPVAPRSTGFAACASLTAPAAFLQLAEVIGEGWRC